MLKIFIPLMENGIKFFQRTIGHSTIERLLDDNRVAPCREPSTIEGYYMDRIVPPNMKLFTISSIQTEIAVERVTSGMQFTGELTNLAVIYKSFLSSIDYEMQILTSPAEAPLIPYVDDLGNFLAGTKTYAADVIVKPEIPFYYSPLCNVVYPNMIVNISVSQDDYNVPTRIVVQNNDVPNQRQAGPNTYFRAPASIREAIAGYKGEDKGVDEFGNQIGLVTNGNLVDTLGSSHNIIGLFEQGRIPKAEKSWFPKWLSYYSEKQFMEQSSGDGWPAVGTADYNYLERLETGWAYRYGTQNRKLNPWSQVNGLKAYQRILLAATDYKYSMSVARSRAGNVELIFNPYIIPGYPMDIIDDTPNCPSYHAYCTSVTHTITNNSISTSVSFVSATTYTELANYFSVPIHPWLQCVFDLAAIPTIVNNTGGKVAADNFYTSVFNIGAAGPEQLYDFNTGEVLPVKRVDRGLVEGTKESRRPRNPGNGGELNPNLTGQGNLSLAYRPIETRKSVEERDNIQFVDIIPANYNPNVIKIANSKLQDASDYLEPGQSQWLQYSPKFHTSKDDLAKPTEGV